MKGRNKRMQPRFNFLKAVKEYGGFTGLAVAMDESLSTVHGWHRRKKVPPWRKKEIIAMAKKHRKDVFGRIEAKAEKAAKPAKAATKKKRTKRVVQ